MKQQSKAMRQQSNISHFFTHIYFSFCACQMILPLCNGRASWPGPFSPLCHEPLALSLGTNWLSLGRKGLKEGSQAPDASTAHEPSPRPQPPDSPQYKCVTQTPVEGTPASTPALGWVSTRASRRGLSSGWGQNSNAQVNHSPEQNSTWSGAKGVGKTGGESRISVCGHWQFSQCSVAATSRERGCAPPASSSAPHWRPPSALSLHDPTTVSLTGL